MALIDGLIDNDKKLASLILLKNTEDTRNSRLKSKNQIQFENKMTKIDTLFLTILFQ